VRSAHNAGPGVARNRGIALSTGHGSLCWTPMMSTIPIAYGACWKLRVEPKRIWSPITCGCAMLTVIRNQSS